MLLGITLTLATLCGSAGCLCPSLCAYIYLRGLLAHLSQRLIGELIGQVGLLRLSVYCLSVHRPYSLNISSETTGSIEVKFHMESPWNGGMKVCSNSPGHMTKMAAMPIYGKNLKKSSSPEPKGWWPWNIVCSIGCSSTTKFVQMMTLGWSWLILR